MKKRHKSVFVGVFLVITPPALALLSAAKSVAFERHVREGRIASAPYWDVLFPISIVACFLLVPLGGYMLFKAVSDPN